jgi:hypothetical protein
MAKLYGFCVRKRFSTQLPPAVCGLLAELLLLARSSQDQAMRAGA